MGNQNSRHIRTKTLFPTKSERSEQSEEVSACVVTVVIGRAGEWQKHWFYTVFLVNGSLAGD